MSTWALVTQDFRVGEIHSYPSRFYISLKNVFFRLYYATFYLLSKQKHQNLAKTSKSCKNIKILQKHQNLAKTSKSCKNIKILQKHQNLAKTSKSFKNIKILQKHQNLIKTSKSTLSLFVIYSLSLFVIYTLSLSL